MKFYSTNNKSHIVSLKEAVIKGLAPDKGLYMPVEIPKMSPDFFAGIRQKSFKEIGYEVIRAFFKEDLTEGEITELVDHTLAFDAPLVEIEKDEMQDYFPEIFAKKTDCRFYNCNHTNEPKCAVVEAVENGEIEVSRYESYLTFLEEIDEDDYSKS